MKRWIKIEENFILKGNVNSRSGRERRRRREDRKEEVKEEGRERKERRGKEIFESFTVEAGQRCERFDQIYVLVVLQTHGFKIFAQHLFGEENKTHINPKSFSSRLKLVYLI